MIKKILRKLIPKKVLKGYQLLRLHDQMSYSKDGLYTIHNCNFIQNEAFKKAYKAGKATGSWGDNDIEWRTHTVLWAAKKSFNLEGDFVECGVNKGGLSRAIVDYLEFGKSSKRFFLLDTFEGLAPELLSAQEKEKYEKNQTGYTNSFDEVVKTFKEFPNVKIIKGAVPYTLHHVETEKVSYLSIDMNCVQPEIAALDFFWPKMVSGGTIVLDDFAYAGFEEQNVAHTEWAKKNKIEILTLPTGQGLIIKP